MGNYRHLTIAEREEIMIFHHGGHSLSEMAKKLGCHKSTISREIKRNSGEEG